MDHLPGGVEEGVGSNDEANNDSSSGQDNNEDGNNSDNSGDVMPLHNTGGEEIHDNNSTSAVHVEVDFEEVQ
jgi:hypothetical protein